MNTTPWTIENRHTVLKLLWHIWADQFLHLMKAHALKTLLPVRELLWAKRLSPLRSPFSSRYGTIVLSTFYCSELVPLCKKRRQTTDLNFFVVLWCKPLVKTMSGDGGRDQQRAEEKLHYVSQQVVPTCLSLFCVKIKIQRRIFWVLVVPAMTGTTAPQFVAANAPAAHSFHVSPGRNRQRPHYHCCTW